METAKSDRLLRCDLPPKEALRRAMLVKPPADWKKAKPSKKRPASAR
jgi:hypothetical protein